MKKIIFAALGVALLTPAVSMAWDVYSPDDGVLCDKKFGFCADDQGISMAYTKDNLGDAAQRSLMDRVNRQGLNLQEFTLSDGTFCSARRHVCTMSKTNDTIATANTQVLFGKEAAAGGAGGGGGSGATGTAKPSAAITFPEKGVICDKLSGFCVDDQGISAAFTKMYLGAAAEAKIVGLMSENPDMDTANYVLSNGVDCRSGEHACMAERRGSAVEPRYTEHLFGN